MSVTDSLADFLTRIRNASRAGHRYVDVRFSNLNENISAVLKEQGFVEHFIVKHEGGLGTIRLFLRYAEGLKPVIQGLKKISNPGRRRYVRADEIPSVRNGLGISIISTSRGVLVGHEARKQKVGGELICYVW